MNMLRRTASALLAAVLLFGTASALQAKEAEPEAETPLMQIVGDLLGVRYKSGGSTPKGFDCSGFTRYVFEKLAGIKLNRRSADQATQGAKVAKDKLREGDLVFFKTNGKSISHVGIYIGDGKFAHASSKKGITITPLNDKYYAKRYVTARRILTDEQYGLLASRAAAEDRLLEALAEEADGGSDDAAGADGADEAVEDEDADGEEPDEAFEEEAGDDETDDAAATDEAEESDEAP